MKKIQKINGHPVSYFVNEEKRMVGAVIRDCWHDVVDRMYKEYGIIPSSNKKSHRRWLMPDVLKSVATCHLDDVFDIEEGKRIASKRLRKKYWLKYSTRMAFFAAWLIDVKKRIVDDADSAFYKAKSIDPLANITKED